MPDKPRIGITTSPRRGTKYYLPYRRAVEAAGAEPVELPPGTSALPRVDGLLLPGGWDVDPSFYG
ncbi:MAG TPA: gamma-glutamyl-gamma-aminobutyrate hydrolase family protein, partial [Candidatus Dormibacteraeota bacterium]|nr:gamma-glutamyl-gamma-aminobutyrate hydrolase family protein [Candidatus Dormibacteraeota bacterium]